MQERALVLSDTCSQFFSVMTSQVVSRLWIYLQGTGFGLLLLCIVLTMYFINGVVHSGILLSPQERKVAVSFLGLTDRCITLAERGLALLSLSCSNCLVSLITLVCNSLWLLVTHNPSVFPGESIRLQ